MEVVSYCLHPGIVSVARVINVPRVDLNAWNVIVIAIVIVEGSGCGNVPPFILVVVIL